MGKPRKVQMQDEVIACLLELSPDMWNSRCAHGECKCCGWNHQVDLQRKAEIKRHGLTKGKDGKRRLIVKKERETVERNKVAEVKGSGMNAEA